jgi:SMC interacting uncharacterized protein involved in chromosome segregation
MKKPKMSPQKKFDDLSAQLSKMKGNKDNYDKLWSERAKLQKEMNK